MIAIDQDKAGKQGRRVWQSGDQEICLRDLAGGDQAIAVFNHSADKADVKVTWAALGVKAPRHGRDLWAHKDVKFQIDALGATVPGHGVVVWRTR